MEKLQNHLLKWRSKWVVWRTRDNYLYKNESEESLTSPKIISKDKGLYVVLSQDTTEWFIKNTGNNSWNYLPEDYHNPHDIANASLLATCTLSIIGLFLKSDDEPFSNIMKLYQLNREGFIESACKSTALYLTTDIEDFKEGNLCLHKSKTELKNDFRFHTILAYAINKPHEEERMFDYFYRGIYKNKKRQIQMKKINNDIGYLLSKNNHKRTLEEMTKTKEQ